MTAIGPVRLRPGQESHRARQKEISDDALAELVSRVGPNARQLDSED